MSETLTRTPLANPNGRQPLEDPTRTQTGRPPRQWMEDYFVYNIGPVVVNAGAQGQATIQVQADSWFLWERCSYYATIADAAFVDDQRPIPSVAVQITDSGSGRQLFQTAQPIPSVFGTGELPYLLPTPRYFKPNSLVQVQLTNFDAAVNYSIRLSFIGSKIFEYN